MEDAFRVLHPALEWAKGRSLRHPFRRKRLDLICDPSEFRTASPGKNPPRCNPNPILPMFNRAGSPSPPPSPAVSNAPAVQFHFEELLP